MVREFYHKYKQGTFHENALVNIRGVVFRVSSDDINEFLGLSCDISSELLDVEYIDDLNEMGRTLCDNKKFEWGKQVFISQNELTKVSAFWHLFVCANVVPLTNATELNKEKVKIVYVLVTNKPLNLGEILIEHIESVACIHRVDKKLPFPGFITHFCMAHGVKRVEKDVLLPPLEFFCEKHVVYMSYKEKGDNDILKIFGEIQESSNVSSSSYLSDWAIQLKDELVESKKEIVELKARVKCLE